MLEELTMAQNLLTVIDFSSTRRKLSWRIVNDGVMGGLSQSRMTITSDSTAVFQGTVSLENNGGFASVRTEPSDFGLAGKKGLRLKVKGDGSTYQLRLRTEQRWDGIAYRSSFTTKEGDWIIVDVDFKDFSPSFRGRPVPEAPALDPGQVRQIGFLISDKQEGSFRLEIDSIRAYE
jgi:monofunctional biosynthetic peptidoglycan transglycosylase